MEIPSSGFSAGLGAIQSGLRRLDQTAGEIASTNVRSADASTQSSAELAGNLVELTVSKLQTQAGGKVVATADDVLGTLIDTHA
ncbi:hypothetical protein [Pseudomonas sp. TCU-HL1]|uniref:hypothetical protein n=1 Tax=Pseudomonas sp. TCU-HL1 TaxID=1856685 RepID=UPI00083E26C6|nr:hypothetical protein [Pseudomonas sp. TCU-HL1]AOE82984.1 hypothetical protein THL1_436 [Pseudomonas sp. TCU-HL1]